jgi:hypothetical protein
MATFKGVLTSVWSFIRDDMLVAVESAHDAITGWAQSAALS